MQTFLPYPDFKKSLHCLDKQRVGKQRVEATQILNILLGVTTKKGWRNHPAVKMWEGYENALILYRNLAIEEWKTRKNKDGNFCKNNMLTWEIKGDIVYPYWFGMEEFHSKHRGTLLFKKYDYYIKYGWTETPKYEYLWPKEKLVINKELTWKH